MALNLGVIVAVAVGWVFVLLLITCLRQGKKDKDIEKQKQNHLVANDVKSKEKHGHSNPGFDEISEITTTNNKPKENNITKSPKKQPDDTPMQITNVKPTANGISNDIKHVTTVTVEINAEDNNNSMSNDPVLKDTTDDDAKTTKNGPVSDVVDAVEKNHIENGHVSSENQEDVNEDDVKIDVQDAEPDGRDLSANPNKSPCKDEHESSPKNEEETLPQVEPAADEASPAGASSPPPAEPEENEQESAPEEKDEDKPGTSASAQENADDRGSDGSGSVQGVPPIPPLSQLSREEKRKYYEKRQDADTGEVTCEITRAALLAAMQNGDIPPNKRVPLSYCDSGSDGEDQEADDGQSNVQQGDNADAADNQSHDQQQEVSKDSAEIADGQSSDQQQGSSKEPDESAEAADDQRNDQQRDEKEVKHDTADDQSNDQQHASKEAAEGKRNDQPDDIGKDSNKTDDDESNEHRVDVKVDENQEGNVTVATLVQDGVLGTDEKADEDSGDKLSQEKETENSGDNLKPKSEQVVDNVGSKSSVDNATGDKEEEIEEDKDEGSKKSVDEKLEHSVKSNLEQKGVTENEKNDELAKSETTDEKMSENQDSSMTVNKNETSIPIPPKFEQNDLQKAAPSTDAADRKTPVRPHKDTSKARNTVKETESKEPAKKPAGIAQTIAKLNQIQQEKLAAYQYSAKPKPKPPVQASKTPAPRPADIVRYTPPKKKDNAEYWPAQRASLGLNEGAARFDMEAELQQRLRATDGVGLRSGGGTNRHKGRVMRKSYGGTQN